VKRAAVLASLEAGRAKHLYERLYCARGQAENHIKAWENHLVLQIDFHQWLDGG
jgi:hypothetical protein